MIGTRIKQLRLTASMTQEQLAQKLGISAQAVSKWESGVNMPDKIESPRTAVRGLISHSYVSANLLHAAARSWRVEQESMVTRFANTWTLRM